MVETGRGSSGGSPRRRKTQGNVHQDRGALEQRGRGAEEQGSKRAEKEIVEAQGWIFHENGVVELVAYKTDPNGAPVQPQDPRVCPNTSF